MDVRPRKEERWLVQHKESQGGRDPPKNTLGRACGLLGAQPHVMSDAIAQPLPQRDPPSVAWESAIISYEGIPKVSTVKDARATAGRTNNHDNNKNRGDKGKT